MPYESTHDLPGNLQSILPQHAQDIYVKAYNNAWDEYKDESRRRGSESREEVSHKVAWSAVEKQYEKGKDGQWREKAR